MCPCLTGQGRRTTRHAHDGSINKQETTKTTKKIYPCQKGENLNEKAEHNKTTTEQTSVAERAKDISVPEGREPKRK